MSDPRSQRDMARGLEQTQVGERSPLYLPWAQERLIPVPLASSGATIFRMPLPWTVNILALYASVYITTTNNATNFWTITLTTGIPASTVVASFTTAALAADTWSRLSKTTGIVQPVSTDEELELSVTATLSPGSIYIVPAVALLRTGN